MTNIKHYKLFKAILGVIVLLLSLGVAVGMLYSIINYYASVKCIETEENVSTTMQPLDTTIDTTTVHENTEANLLDYFKEARGDGIKLVFYHGANSQEEVTKALEGDYHVLEADIILSPVTQQPIMAHPPQIQSDITLEEWFAALTSSSKAIKMDIKTTEVITPALNTLRSFTTDLHQPVWINADVVPGPNSKDKPINAKLFLEEVNRIYPNVTLSLGWTTWYRILGDNEGYSWEAIDEMYSLAKKSHQSVTFPARAIFVRSSWDKFIWLLEQSNRFSLTIWTGNGDPVDTADIIFVRDNFDISRVFYDAYNWLMDPVHEAIELNTYPKTFYTGGNVLDYFRIYQREAIQVKWAHRVNDVDILNGALNDDEINMLEADVRLYQESTSDINATYPVMAHDVLEAYSSNLTLEDWLTMVVTSNKSKGVKLDFKSIDVAIASMIVLNNMKSFLDFPIWLNADVLSGPGSFGQTPVNATRFFSSVTSHFPHATLSPGWTTAYVPGGNQQYTQTMVEEMYYYCLPLRQAITFPVRASIAKASVSALQWLLSKSNRYSLTVWHSSPTPENLTSNELYEIYKSFPADKVYFDLPKYMMDSLWELINS